MTKQLLCQKNQEDQTYTHTHPQTHRRTHTHAKQTRRRLDGDEWKQECQNDVAEDDHSILTALTVHANIHTHTHTRCTRAELTEGDGRGR